MSELTIGGINFGNDDLLDFAVRRHYNVSEQAQEPENVYGQTDAEKAIGRAEKVVNRGKHDSVNHPQHYTSGGIECIDAIEAAISTISDPVEAFITGQVIKYLWRYKLKNGIEDLRKAKWYLDRLIKKEGQNNEDNT